MDPARAERHALCELLEELGPEARTLLPGWRTSEMAAHLLARDTRPDAIPGMVLPVASRWTERVQRGIVETGNYSEVVRRLRAGPPALSAGRLPGGWRADLHEWFVHHEDVRRANGLGRGPTARTSGRWTTGSGPSSRCSAPSWPGGSGRRWCW